MTVKVSITIILYYLHFNLLYSGYPRWRTILDAFCMRIALRVVRIQYRDSVRRLVFSPYNKFCNPLGYVTFWVAISSNLPAPSFIRDPALSQTTLSTLPSSFNRGNAPSTHPRFDLSSSPIMQRLAVHLHSIVSFLYFVLSHCLSLRLIFGRVFSTNLYV